MTSPQRARVFSLTPAYRVSDPKARGDQRAAKTPLLGGTYGARQPAGNVGHPPATAFEGPNVSQATHLHPPPWTSPATRVDSCTSPAISTSRSGCSSVSTAMWIPLLRPLRVLCPDDGCGDHDVLEVGIVGQGRLTSQIPAALFARRSRRVPCRTRTRRASPCRRGRTGWYRVA